MPIAVDPKGNTVFLDVDGQWKPAQTAVNTDTKEMLAFDGKDWSAVPKQSKGVFRHIDDAVRALANGATVGWADEFAAKGNELVGNGNYADNLAAEKARDAQIPDAIKYPGEIVGAIGSTFAAAPITGTVAAITGASKLPAIIRGTVVGTGAGALSGAGNADPGQRTTGAVQGGAVGGVVGAAAGPVLSGIQTGLQTAGNYLSPLVAPIVNSYRGFRDPTAEASRRVSGAITKDVQNGTPGLAPTEFRAAQAEGQPVNVMDLGGETTRALARSAANTSPEGRAVLDQAINQRFEGQAPRVAGWLEQTFNYPNASAQQQALGEVARNVNRPAYRAAYDAGDRQIWSPELERLTSAPSIQGAMHSAVTKWRDWAVHDGFGGANPGAIVENGMVQFGRGANGAPVYPNIQFWDYTARHIADAAAEARRAGRMQEATRLGGLERQLKSELDKIVPEFQTARRGAAGFFGAENALEAGQNFVGASAKFGTPEARAALEKMSSQERQLFQDGYVSRLVEKINTTPDRRDVLNKIAQSPAAREELNLALGQRRAAEFESVMRVEGVMDLARRATQGNSTTARQLIEAGLAGGTGYGITTGDYDPRSLLTAAFIGGVARRGVQRIDTRVARQVADMLVSNDPAVLSRGAQIVASRPALLDGLRRADLALARVGGQQSSSIPALQAPGTGRADQTEPQIPRPPGQ